MLASDVVESQNHQNLLVDLTLTTHLSNYCDIYCYIFIFENYTFKKINFVYRYNVMFWKLSYANND